MLPLVGHKFFFIYSKLVNNPFNKNTKNKTLPVHVVCSRSGVISEPDTEVLNFQRVLLLDLLAGCRTTVHCSVVVPAVAEVPALRQHCQDPLSSVPCTIALISSAERTLGPSRTMSRTWLVT